jgi:hypothetical protein
VGAVLAILCPDLGMFELTTITAQGDITAGVVAQLTGYAAMYVAAYTVVSHLFFVEKEL